MLVAGQQSTTGADRIRMGMFTKLLAGLFVAMLCGVYFWPVGADFQSHAWLPAGPDAE